RRECRFSASQTGFGAETADLRRHFRAISNSFRERFTPCPGRGRVLRPRMENRLMMFDWTTTTLPTWPSPRFVEHDRTDDFENPRRGSRAQAAAAAAIAIGLVLGGLAWAWWRRRQAAVASVPAPVAHATIPVAEPAPAPARVWVPQTWAEIQRMLRGVGAWIRLAPHTDDHQLAQTIWAAFWGDAPFPRLGSDDP